ncbi:hypothetical protein LTR55_011507 [Exophiala xenobiotica]|nr:hypothetical protein LTR14_011213 [Exophiala xenobiotica]KAK5468964.1 hypothetical protein LTR55_011507 [Exophiala xenobiotica]
MVSIQCHAGTGSDDIWEYCPSFAAAILFAVLFGITSSAHVIQAFIYRKPFAAVLIMGALWEFGGYVARILSIKSELSSGVFTAQLLLILLAPLWINAYVYMLLGRMIHIFLKSDRVYGIKARLITRIFVIFDIVAFLIQATGGMLTGPGVSVKLQKIGLNVYTGGVGAQLLFLAIFVALAVGFQRRLNKQQRTAYHATCPDQITVCHSSPYGSATLALESQDPSPAASRTSLEFHSPEPTPDDSLAKPVIRTMYAVLFLIIARNVYRLAEFASGAHSPTVTHEWYAYIFDAVPMFVALVVLNIFYPRKALQGPRCDFSEQDNQRKQSKKDRKALKKAEKKHEGRGRSEAKKMGLTKDNSGYEPMR